MATCRRLGGSTGEGNCRTDAARRKQRAEFLTAKYAKYTKGEFNHGWLSSTGWKKKMEDAKDAKYAKSQLGTMRTS